MLVLAVLVAGCGSRGVPDAPRSDGGVDTDSSSFFPCGPVHCASSAACCDGECVDLASHALHCGACGAACSPTEVCSEGGCVCADWVVECAGACTDVRGSREHCGACDEACATGSACIGGACIPGDGSDCGSCLEPWSGCCEGACVRLDDAAHCGACDVRCDEPAEPDCVDGECTVILI